VLRAVGETETMQENIQEWLEVDGDTGFQLMTEEDIAAVIFFYLFSSALPTLINCLFICFLRSLSFMTLFCFITQDYRLIQISEGLPYNRSSLQGIWSIRGSSF
jgi:hypothetical protein